MGILPLFKFNYLKIIDMNIFSQVELIKKSRWEMALFTTYALSLTFFETYLLPQLRKSRCEKIIILVDVDGYQSSLMELKSRHVGQEYFLIPVKLKDGIFHPKISYLCGQDEDLLMIGSGNLTFGGHGRNLESLEILNSNHDSAAFGDFARFIEKLLSDERISFRRIEELNIFKLRVEKFAEINHGPTSTRLFHTMDGTISNQLINHAKDVKGWNELLILSPYHNPHGEPIKELANSLGISKLTIGVPSNPLDTSSFPFSLVEGWGMEFQIVSPKVENPKRPLHAKWIELRGNENWSFVGSINATYQSLSTTKNIEIGVLRVLNGSSDSNWIKTKKPIFQEDKFILSNRDDKTSLVLDAQLSSGGQINGHILGLLETSNNWQAFLESSDKIIENSIVKVAEDGSFKWNLKSFSEFDNLTVMQLRLETDGLIARGWLGIESFLKLPSNSRTAIQALSRMLDRSESIDDIHALLDFISIHSNRMIKVSPVNSTLGDAVTVKVVNDVTFHSSELTELTIESEVDLFSELSYASVDEAKSWRVIQVIAKLLLGKKLNNSIHNFQKLPISNNLSLVEDDDDAKALENTINAIEEFNKQVRIQLAHQKIMQPKVSQLFFIWISVNLDMYLRRIQDKTSAFLIVSEWMRLVSKSEIPLKERFLLDDCVFGLSASLAWYIHKVDETSQKFFGISLTTALIHQWLESYCEGPVNRTLALQKARLWFEHEIGMLLVNYQPKEALDALELTLESKTIRGALELILTTHESGSKPLVPEGMFSQEEETLLLIVINSDLNRPAYRRVNHHKIKGCPKCHQSLIKDSLVKLSARRLTKCIGMSCKTILISLEA